MDKKLSAVGICIWLLASLFFLYEFFLQVFLSTVSTEIMHDLNLDASSYSILASGYFIFYALMQIPVGILVDRYGARWLLTLAISTTVTGVFGFSFANSFTLAFLSRCLMGLGSSFAYVSLLILALNWFPRKYFALMVGVANFLGAMGPFLAGGPLSLLLSAFNNNWRLILTGIGYLGVCLAVLVGLIVRTSPSKAKHQVIHLDPYKKPLKTRLKLLAKNKHAWSVVLCAGFVYVSLPLLGAYWGTSFLQAHGFGRTIAATTVSLLWIGYAIGAPLSGKISDIMHRRKPILILGGALGVVSSILLVYLPTMQLYIYSILFLLIGLASASCSTSFPTISEHVRKDVQGTSIGFNNSVMVFFAAIFPPITSYLIEFGIPNDVHHYTVINYQHGLFVMPIFYAFATLIAVFLVKETFCRSQHEVIKVNLR